MFTFLRARITYHQESAGKIPTEWGMGSSFTFFPGLTHFVSRKEIALLLNQLKFERTDNVFIKGIHSGLWQNLLSLLAQMVVEQEADKLFRRFANNIINCSNRNLLGPEV